MIAPDRPSMRADRMERAAAVRWVICAVLVCAFAPGAAAGDLFVLRGPQPTFQWGGVYFGGQVGYSSSNVNFSSAAGPDISYILRNTTIEADEGLSNWAVLPPVTSTGSVALGGFVGYNTQWDDVVLGMEANYNRVSLTASSSGIEERSFVDSKNIPAGHHYFYDATVAAQAAMQMTDIASFRARAGLAYGNLLPYGFFGLALGRANLSNSATVAYTAKDYPDPTTPPTTPLPDLDFGPVSQGVSQDSTYLYGVAMGFGTDIGLTPNLFVRGELEYDYFFPTDGIHVTVASARVGAGVKF